MIRTVLSALLAIIVLISRDTSAAEGLRPNIVYILADDMGRGDVSALNPSCAWKTPNLDRLAREGTSFADAHSSSAVCTPSRYSILTGRYSWRSARKSGVGGGFSPALIEPGRLTVPSLLQQNGYATAMIGKWHLGLNWARKRDATAQGADDSADGETPLQSGTKAAPVDFSAPFGGGPIACGFDQFLGISASLDMPPYAWLRNDRVYAQLPLRLIKASPGPAMWRAGLAADGYEHANVLPRQAEEAVRYIENHETNKPFFLYVALAAPHTPIVPTLEFAGRTRTTLYGDFCVQVDAAVGQILAALASKRLDEGTLVIFTADNGCSPSANFAELAKLNHDPQVGLRGAKADIYEGGHRVPFVVRWPGKVPANRTSKELIYQGDLLATCAALVGAKLPDDAGEDSVNLLPALLGEELSAPLHEAVVHHSINGSFAIRQGAWKLCLCPDSGGWSDPKPGKAPPDAPMFQLFNLQQDPDERINLYSQHPDVVQRLGQLMKSYVLNGRSTPGVPQKNAGGKAWPGLGWIDQFE